MPNDDDLEVLENEPDTSSSNNRRAKSNKSSLGSALNTAANFNAVKNGVGSLGDKYLAKTSNPGSPMDSINGNPKNPNPVPTPSSSSDNSKEDQQQEKGEKRNQMLDKALKAGQFIPGYGHLFKGAEMAKKAAEKIPGIRNMENKVLSNPGKLGPAGLPGMGGIPGTGDNKSKDQSEKGQKGESGQASGDNQQAELTGKKSIKKAIAIIPLATIGFFSMFIFMITQGNKVQANTMNFAASTIRGEELIAGDMEYRAEDSDSKVERDYINNLSEVYTEQNQQFNPDLVSSTFQVMMFRKQYSNDGYFDYSDISKAMITDLAKRIKGSQVQSGNGSSSTGGAVPTIDGVVAVASDAALVPPFGNMVPENIVDTGRASLDDSGTCRMTNEAWAAFQVMEQAAAADGVTIGTNSCYRSAEEQAHTSGNSPAAAGYSEHQLGSTVDIANHDVGIIDTPEVNNWLYANSEKYGFINRHWDMSNETHHFRFVGTAVAAEYAKLKTSTSGRPTYSMSYPEFVKTEAAQKLFASNSKGSTNPSAASGAGENTSSSSSSSNSSVSNLGSADAVIAVAEKEIGTGETNQVTKYGSWYGLPTGEWCAMFVSWCANQAGVSEDVIPKYALVSDGREWFQARGLYHEASGYTPKKGDVVFYSGHTGLVKDALADGTVITIEGNTYSYSNPIVYEWTMSPGDSRLASIIGYGSPEYTNKSSTSSSSSSNSGNVNNDEQYRQTIKEFLMENMKGLDDNRADLMVTEIFDFKNDYYDLIGKRFDDCSSDTVTSSAGSCTYNIKGFSNGGSKIDSPMEISDLKVRLMQCLGGRGQPVEGEELIPFEKYILGVTYAEVGDGFPAEATKAEAIAARSYALARPTLMGNSMGTLLTQEDGQWILQLRSCTEDQVYCDPDRGCSRDSGSSGATHYSGTDHPYIYKQPLPADDPMREQVAETNGKVLVDSEGYIVNANYLDVDQRAWQAAANAGKDVNQILVEHYASSGATKIEEFPCDGASSSSSNSNCKTSSENYSAPGDYASWRQWAEPWGSFQLADDGSTMGDIGCTITAISMLVAKSGIPTGNITNFNPGTLAQEFKNRGITGSDGNSDIGRVDEVIPGFKYVGKYEFDITSNSSAEGNAIKVAKAKELIDQGYYVLVSGSSMYGGGGHWVAIDRVEGDTIIMMDPYRDNTDMLNTYGSTYAFHYYKAEK